MIFNNPDTLRVLISLFFAVAAVSAALAVAALRLAVREPRSLTSPRVVLAGRFAGVPSPRARRHAA